MKVFLTGATGFVGRRMLQRLLAEGHTVRALVRDGRKLRTDERAELCTGDVVSRTGLDGGLQGSNTFERVHHIGTHNVVEAARRSGIRRLIHMSALGARADGVAAYQTSKWKGEEEVRKSGIPFCILRPSLIFGPGDGFVTQMMDTMKKSPLFRPIPGDGSPKFRPIHVDDVTFCFARALTLPAVTNQTVELGGADELTLDQVLSEIARCGGVRKPALHIPMPLMILGAKVASVLPNPPVTVDQLRMLQEGSTCDVGPMMRLFGFTARRFAGCGR
jgi:uncharacterized protein YbjT (DUF2867 family)